VRRSLIVLLGLANLRIARLTRVPNRYTVTAHEMGGMARPAKHQGSITAYVRYVDGISVF